MMAGRSLTQLDRIRAFHALHKNPPPPCPVFLLPNAWDPLSAKVLAAAGAPAIATTSAGVAHAMGFADGQRLPKDLLLEAVGRIISSVPSTPVSVDLEAGYGATPDEVAHTVGRVIELGAVGINLEDLDPVTEQLYPLKEQVDKIRTIRALAEAKGLPFFINARTDVYLGAKYVGWPAEKKYAETIERLQAFEAAGADGLFVPGLTDLEVIKKLTTVIKLPLNVLAGGWITSLGALKEVGVARVSTGSGLARAAMTATQESYAKAAQGDFGFLNTALSYDAINGLFHD